MPQQIPTGWSPSHSSFLNPELIELARVFLSLPREEQIQYLTGLSEENCTIVTRSVRLYLLLSPLGRSLPTMQQFVSSITRAEQEREASALITLPQGQRMLIGRESLIGIGIGRAELSELHQIESLIADGAWLFPTNFDFSGMVLHWRIFE